MRFTLARQNPRFARHFAEGHPDGVLYTLEASVILLFSPRPGRESKDVRDVVPREPRSVRDADRDPLGPHPLSMVSSLRPVN